ncbi:MAG: spermidine/putrescine ABC transporter substrate-binding protein PotF, partial [Natronospirillum sp.]
WSDMLAIPVDAPNLDNAYAFIDYILEAEVSADITNYVWYGNPNIAAREFIDEDILEDPGVFPPPGTELFTFEVRPPNIERLLTRSWNAVKAGN